MLEEAMVPRAAFYTAGALLGAAEGVLRAALALAPAAAPAAAPPPPTSLHSLLVVGDRGAGAAPLARAWARCGDDAHSAPFLFREVDVDGQRAAFTVWHLGGREDVLELGTQFCSLASAWLIAYRPDDAQGNPLESLEYWARVCIGDGGIPATLPLVVVASSPADTPAARSGIAAGEQWCREHGGVPHHVVAAADSVDAAFGAACRRALRRHKSHGHAAAWELPALRDSELVAALGEKAAACRRGVA